MDLSVIRAVSDGAIPETGEPYYLCTAPEAFHRDGEFCQGMVRLRARLTSWIMERRAVP
jgi:hypothetical protein